MEIPNIQSHERLRSWVSLALAESCIDLLVVCEPLGNFLVAIIFGFHQTQTCKDQFVGQRLTESHDQFAAPSTLKLNESGCEPLSSNQQMC